MISLFFMWISRGTGMVDSGDYQDKRRLGMDKRKSAELELIGQQGWIMEVHGRDDGRKTRLYTEADKWVEQAIHDIGGVALHLRQNFEGGKNLWVLRNEEPLYGKGQKLANRHGVHRIKTFIDNFAGTNPKHPYFKSFKIILHVPKDEQAVLLETLGVNKTLVDMRSRAGIPITFKDKHGKQIDVDFSSLPAETITEKGVALHRDDPAVEKPFGWKTIIQPPLKGFDNDVGRKSKNMLHDDTNESPDVKHARMAKNRRNQKGPMLPGL
jgi:hypothetical protein